MAEVLQMKHGTVFVTASASVVASTIVKEITKEFEKALKHHGYKIKESEGKFVILEDHWEDSDANEYWLWKIERTIESKLREYHCGYSRSTERTVDDFNIDTFKIKWCVQPLTIKFL